MANAEALVNQLAKLVAPLVTNLAKSKLEKERLKKFANNRPKFFGKRAGMIFQPAFITAFSWRV